MSSRITPEGRILRYQVAPRIIHALLASSFLLLLTTGIVYLVTPLAAMAGGTISQLLHRAGAVAYMAVPLVYLLFDRRGAKELLVDSFRYDRDDLEWLKASYRYFVGYAAEMPPQGRLNAGQKLHHAGVIILSATIVASGAMMWFAKGNLGPTLLGAAATVHGLSMLGLTVLMAGHLYFTFVYRALSSMTTGYVSKDAARLEHPKWVDELERQHNAQAAAD